MLCSGPSQYLSSPPSSPVRRLLSVGASRWASVLTELPSWQDKTKTKQVGSPSHFLEVQYTCETILSPSVGANYMLFKAKVKDGLSCSKPPSQSNPRVHTISLTIQFSFTVALASNSVIMWISIFRRLGTDWGLPLMSCVSVVTISTPKSIRNWVYFVGNDIIQYSGELKVKLMVALMLDNYNGSSSSCWSFDITWTLNMTRS